jgi:hypothetical protein
MEKQWFSQSAGNRTTMGVEILLSGRLRLDGYGRGKRENGDGTFHLDLREGSSVRDVIAGMGVPSRKVALTMINGRKCTTEAEVKPNDRVILIPEDVAALWRALGVMNMNMESVFDY